MPSCSGLGSLTSTMMTALTLGTRETKGARNVPVVKLREAGWRSNAAGEMVGVGEGHVEAVVGPGVVEAEGAGGPQRTVLVLD